jgi:hypothetical protein
MFKNKYLKQLQDVQARIKNCKELINKLSPPEPDSFRVGCDIYSWLCAMLHTDEPQVASFYDVFFTGFDDSNCDYMRKLGEYLINFADYEKKKKEYTMEFERLHREERRLKEKLGIS